MNDLRRIQAFLEAKSAETGASQNTLSAYARDLADFHEFLNDQKQDLMQIDMAGVETYLVDLVNRDLSRATRARRLSQASPSLTQTLGWAITACSLAWKPTAVTNLGS